VPWEILACPFCRGALEKAGSGAHCLTCGDDYPPTASGQLDLRLRRPKRVDIGFELTAPPTELPAISLEAADQSALDFSQLPLPASISSRFASYLPRPRQPGAMALDLGCGDCRARAVLEHAGFKYVGIDLAHPGAPLLADGHALPFAPGSFELVLSISVVEFFRYPHVAMGEVARVLQSAATFAGNVAFLHPFLPDTHFHHTAMGITSLLRTSGLEIERLMVDRRWTVLECTGTLGLFPRLPIPLVRALMAPVKALHLIWWRIGSRLVGRPLSESERLLRIAGGIEYIARKPAENSGLNEV
jgi:SAM-dependent methyltransferase